jgi:GGDEF domain-containing protein
MEKTSKNLSSKHRRPQQNAVFFEVNPKVAVVQSNLSDITQSKVINWLDDTYNTEAGNAALKMYARTLGVNLKRKDHFIQNDLIRIAKENPKEFLQGFASTAHNRKYYLITAEENGIINADRTSGQVTFNGNPLFTAPPGEDPIDYFVRFAIDPQGAKIYDAVRQKVDARKVHDFTMAGNADMQAVIDDVQKVIDRILQVEEEQVA